MPDYIDRDVAIRTIENMKRPGKSLIILYLQEIKSADVALMKHGKWIFNTDDFVPKCRCSVCGYNRPIMSVENVKQEPSNFCNNCGCKMDLED